MTKIAALLIVLFLLAGCGVTRTNVTLADGSICSSSTYTAMKDVAGGKFNGCGANWGVESSNPNEALANSTMQLLNTLLPLAIKGASAGATP